MLKLSKAPLPRLYFAVATQELWYCDVCGQRSRPIGPAPARELPQLLALGHPWAFTERELPGETV